MKLIGKFIMFIFAVCILAVVYWYSPALMHSQSRLLNFLQLVGVALVVGLSLIMLMGVIVMNFGSSSAPPPKMVAPPKARSVPADLSREFDYIRKELHEFGNANAIGEYTNSVDARLESLCRAVNKLAAITELNSSK